MFPYSCFLFIPKFCFIPRVWNLLRTRETIVNMDYVRYLESKRSVDDRALDDRVLQDAERYFQGQFASLNQSRPLRIVEVGAGVGAMCRRLYERGTFSKCKHVEYLLIDFKADVILAAKNAIRCMASCSMETPEANRNETTVKNRSSSLMPGSFSVHHHKIHHKVGTAKEIDSDVDLRPIYLDDGFSVSFAVHDALEYAKSHTNCFDIVIAAAVLDLWELSHSIPLLLSMLCSDGLKAFYFPINFDGTTALLPPTIEGTEFDQSVEDDFHKAMGSHSMVAAGSVKVCAPAAHTGRHLLMALRHNGAQVRSVGSSGWIVLPSAEKPGHYPHDEKYFLQCITDFIETSVPGMRDGSDDKDWNAAFSRYVRNRKEQIEGGELCYVAHNIDVFGTYGGMTWCVTIGFSRRCYKQVWMKHLCVR